MVNDEKSLRYMVDTINDDNAYAYIDIMCMSVCICLYLVTLSLCRFYVVLNNYNIDASTFLDIHTSQRLARDIENT